MRIKMNGCYEICNGALEDNDIDGYKNCLSIISDEDIDLF